MPNESIMIPTCMTTMKIQTKSDRVDRDNDDEEDEGVRSRRGEGRRRKEKKQDWQKEAGKEKEKRIARKRIGHIRRCVEGHMHEIVSLATV